MNLVLRSISVLALPIMALMCAGPGFPEDLLVERARALPLPGIWAPFDELGSAVAVSGDTLVVGAPRHDYGGTDAGAAFVYRRSGSTWQLEARLSGDRPWALFGSAVAVDGDRIVIGAREDDEVDHSAGAAYVFESVDGAWSLETKLLGSRFSRFGWAVAVDGDSVAVGAPQGPGNGDQAGVVTVFDRVADQWIENEVIRPPAAFVGFGHVLSFNGVTLMVGASDTWPPGGAVLVYERDNAGWNLEAELWSLQPGDNVVFGWSLALDGSRAVVGSRNEDENGAAYLYEHDGTEWAVSQRVLPVHAGVGVDFGSAVAIDGDAAVIGMPRGGSTGDGAAVVYRRGTQSWTLEQQLEAATGTNPGELGAAVAVVGDTCVIGAPYGNEWGDNAGMSVVFNRGGGVWTEHQLLHGHGSATEHNFGLAVAVGRDLVVVGAPQDDDAGDDSGAVYVVRRSGAEWELAAKLTAPDAAAWDYLGYAVAVAGEVVLAAAPWHDADELTNDAGAVYVFREGPGGWTHAETWTPQNPSREGFFGWCLAAQADRVAIGTPGDELGGTEQGSVEIYERVGEVWLAVDRVSHLDMGVAGYLGEAVALDGDRLLVGSQVFNEAYVLRHSGGTWVLEAQLVPGGTGIVQFGEAVAIDGTTALVGAPWDDDGKVYVYHYDGSVWQPQTTLIPAGNGLDVRYFGNAVALAGDVAVVGSYGSSFGGHHTGAAHAWRRSPAGWSEEQIVLSSETFYEDRFGWAVAVADGRLVIGAPTASADYATSGAAYVYGIVPVFADGFESGTMDAWHALGDRGAIHEIE